MSKKLKIHIVFNFRTNKIVKVFYYQKDARAHMYRLVIKGEAHLNDITVLEFAVNGVLTAHDILNVIVSSNL